MGISPSSLIESFENNAEKEKKANDALQALIEMAKLQQEKFRLVVETNIGSQKLIPVDTIIREENILKATASSKVTGVADVINTAFSAFVSGEIANGVSTIIQTGLDLLVGSYSGNTSSRSSYVITAGELGGIMRIDMHFFTYQFTSSQLTDICKQVISVSVVVSSVDSSKLKSSTLANIVQTVYGHLKLEEQQRILSQLEMAAKKSLSSTPDPGVVAAHFSRAVKRVGNPREVNPVTDFAKFTIKTTVGSASNAALSFQSYLRGGIVQFYSQPSITTKLVTVQVDCIRSTDDVSNSKLDCEASVTISTTVQSSPKAGAPGTLLAQLIRNLLQLALNPDKADLPIERFTIDSEPPDPGMHERISDTEWRVLLIPFPNLKKWDRDDFWKTDYDFEEAKKLHRPVYNCIAWSMENTYQWIDAPASFGDFVKLYGDCGYEVCSYEDAEIDGYNNRIKMTHGARQDGGQWSSKCGGMLRMIHRRRALEDYGNIVVSFRKTNQIKDVPGPLYHAEVVAASAAKVSSIVDRLAAAFPQMSEAFKTNWKAWADSWLLPGKVSSSSSSTYAEGVEWDRLVAMGANIIPSVVQELSDRYNFFGCSLYNQLQTDASKKISPSDPTQYYVLNNQARDIIKMYGDFIETYEQRSQAWKAEVKSIQPSFRTETYTRGPAYKDLLGMGSAITPLVMYSYSSDKSGLWHELLNELVHGESSDSTTRHGSDSYAQWSAWFQTP